MALRQVRRVEVQLHSFLTSTPGGDKWSVRAQAEVLGRKKFLHLLCRRMGDPGAFLTAVAKREFFVPAGNRSITPRLSLPAVLFTIVTELPRFLYGLQNYECYH